MASNAEIAQELAAVYLSHESIAKWFNITMEKYEGDKQLYRVVDAASTGEKVGEFYNAILKTLQKQS